MFPSPDRVEPTPDGGNMVDQNGVVELKDFTPQPLDGIKDFTLPSDGESLKFRIGADIFDAVSTIPLGLLPDVVSTGANLADGSQDKIEKVLNIFDVLLWDESAAKLRERIRDKKNPISDKHILPIVHWLLEQYGLRPTQPSDTSSSSSDVTDGSTTSTDGVSHVESISATSPSLDS